MSLPLRQRDTCHGQIGTFASLCVCVCDFSRHSPSFCLVWHFRLVQGQEGFRAGPGARSGTRFWNTKRRRKQRADLVEPHGETLSGWKDAEAALAARFPAGVNQQRSHRLCTKGNSVPETQPKHFSPAFVRSPLLISPRCSASISWPPSLTRSISWYSQCVFSPYRSLAPVNLSEMPVYSSSSFQPSRLCIFRQALRVCALWWCMCGGE